MNRALICIFLGVSTVLQGCGFHLRGTAEVPASMRHVLVQGVDPYGPFGAELVAQLRANGVQVVGAPQQASAILRITNQRNVRRVLSVSPQSGKLRELELYYSLDMTVVDRAGKVLVPLQQVSQTRDFTFDELAVLGKTSEEAVLREEMQQDMAQQILRRLQASAVQ